MEKNKWVKNLTDEQLIELMQQWEESEGSVPAPALIRKIAGEINNKSPESTNTMDMMHAVLISACELAKRFKVLIEHNKSIYRSAT